MSNIRFKQCIPDKQVLRDFAFLASYEAEFFERKDKHPKEFAVLYWSVSYN